MQKEIIEALESARGFIDGMIADVRRSGTGADALDYITLARRLRLKSLDVLGETVQYAATTDVSWEDIATRYGLSVAELQARYPEAVRTHESYERNRRAFDDGGF